MTRGGRDVRLGKSKGETSGSAGGPWCISEKRVVVKVNDMNNMFKTLVRIQRTITAANEIHVGNGFVSVQISGTRIQVWFESAEAMRTMIFQKANRCSTDSSGRTSGCNNVGMKSSCPVICMPSLTKNGSLTARCVSAAARFPPAEVPPTINPAWRGDAQRSSAFVTAYSRSVQRCALVLNVDLNQK